VSQFTNLIHATCLGDGRADGPLSGQAFTNDLGGFNVVVGYCNGNDPPTVGPAEYPGPGPNGAGLYCGGNQDFECDLGDCMDDTLVLN
jgi:hypothetical protein